MSRYVSNHQILGGSLQAEQPRGGYVAPSAPTTAWYVEDWERAGEARSWPITVAWIAVVLLALWVVGATGYIIFHDDLLKTAVHDRVRMQTAYEDRISRLRSEVDTINSRLMLNQDEFDTKLDALRLRQAQLEHRQTKLANLLDHTKHPALAAVARLSEQDATGSLQLASAAADAQDTALEPADGHTIKLAFMPRGNVATASRPADAGLSNADLPAAARNEAEHALMRLAQSQTQLEAEQNETLNMLEARSSSASEMLTQAISELGFEPAKLAANVGYTPAPSLAATDRPDAVGGPLVPMVLHGAVGETPFDRQINRILGKINEAATLYAALQLLPVARPLDDSHDITSGFGVRRDPFLGTPALHSGIDFRADTGTPVHATADGIVTMAQRYAGYGNMVDIEHEGGIVTRYGHMSSIAVTAGEQVKAGDLIGTVGSTGRSTGPHLHYETRIGGDAVNPLRFVKAGDRFLAQ